MAEERVQRRLAAILAADVVGYSRMMSNNEPRTLAILKTLRSEVFDPAIANFGGRIFKTTGDGALAEFASAVDAVRCAVEIQATLARQNAEASEDGQMELRIGISLGDIVVDGDDLYGNGVNVAARLEGLADSGGICISGTVQEQIANTLEVGVEDMGEQTVKNIDRPIRCYRVHLESGVTTEVPSQRLPDKPSIAVLPFDNMSGDPEQEYFSDGITEDIITALSHIRQFFVIARNTTFTYKGQAIEVQAVAKDLEVRYVLEGSVRKAGNRVRITAQLIDGESGNHVWAEKYDRDLEDIFDVQDEITQTVVGALGPELTRAEQDRARRKPPEDLAAWDLYQQGMWHVSQGTESDFHEALRLFDEATTQDRGFSAAYSGTSYVYARMVLNGFIDDIAAAGDTALTAAKKAIALDDGDELAHYVAGFVYSTVMREPDLAMHELKKAIELNPNSASSHAQLGQVHAHYGNASECFQEIDLALRISPRDHFTWRTMTFRAYGHYFLRQYEEAEKWARTASLSPDAGLFSLVCCIAANAQLGAIERARIDMDELLRRNRNFSQDFVLKRGPFGPTQRQHLLEGLRKAGLVG